MLRQVCEFNHTSGCSFGQEFASVPLIMVGLKVFLITWAAVILAILKNITVNVLFSIK